MRPLASAPAAVQKRVLDHPSAAFWVDVAWNLVNRRAHQHFSEVHLVPHLREFARFACSAALLVGAGRLTAVVRADSAGRISLPGSGIALVAEAPWTRTRLSIDDGVVTGNPEQFRVSTLASGLELNWLDHDLRLGGRADFAFAELDPVEGQRWQDELNRHLDVINEVSEPLAQELTGGLSVIVPVHSQDPSRHVSGSFQEAPGMVALSLGTRMATVEALVHEYGHQKLNAILPLDPLIIDDTGEAVHYSPWRDDPRPLTGLMHAVCSFETVVDFYRALFDLPSAGGFVRQEIVNRTYRLVRQVRDGITELNRKAVFSPLGHAFVQAISNRLEECAGDLPTPSPEDRRRADAEHHAHRVRWDERHPAHSHPVYSSTKATVSEHVQHDATALAARYAACVSHDPQSPYFWHCYAFALRHLGRHDEALYILTHTETLIARRAAPSPDADVRTTREARAWGLRLPEKKPASIPPISLPVTEPVAKELRASRYWDFIEATFGGGQLPTLIAVAHGLKPAMDVWIPQGGWHAFLTLVQTLGLEYYVDACFDRYSPQLSHVLPDQLTTTRAAFAPSLQEGTEAHVFLARDRAALDRVVGAGWYPLIVNNKVVNKHRADHDKFGDALGYPTCCQDFFRRRNNWNEDNTYYAALRNTQGAPSILCNPYLRHTPYGLVPYMPCSYTCRTTMKFATRLRDVTRAELPAYADAIEHASAKPFLCVSELRNYWFTGETVNRTADTVTITYRGVESLYPVEAADPLFDLLSAGNRCTLDGNIIHVRQTSTYLGGYQARGDRHGPECPFVISFA